MQALYLLSAAARAAPACGALLVQVGAGRSLAPAAVARYFNANQQYHGGDVLGLRHQFADTRPTTARRRRAARPRVQSCAVLRSLYWRAGRARWRS